jgi:hypothetical protein
MRLAIKTQMGADFAAEAAKRMYHDLVQQPLPVC